MGSAGWHERRTWPVVALLVCALGGLLFAAAATTSRGSDLRPAGGDIASLVQDRSRSVVERQARARELQAEVDRLTGSAGSSEELEDLRRRISTLQSLSGLDAASGPGVRVTLADAPRDAAPADVDPNVLVVHEQDLRAFVNALWSGGAEAVSLQGQRLISTSSFTCVGSTVVIEGVPYAPPYVIEAVGDASGMNFSLATSPEVLNYGRYVERYELGLSLEQAEELTVPGYDGTVGLAHATAVREDPVPVEETQD